MSEIESVYERSRYHEKKTISPTKASLAIKLYLTGLNWRTNTTNIFKVRSQILTTFRILADLPFRVLGKNTLVAKISIFRGNESRGSKRYRYET